MLSYLDTYMVGAIYRGKGLTMGTLFRKILPILCHKRYQEQVFVLPSFLFIYSHLIQVE